MCSSDLNSYAPWATFLAFILNHARGVYIIKRSFVYHQGFCSFGAIYLHSLLVSELPDGFVWYANLGPTGYTPCEYAFGVGATHPASPRDALTEQSAHDSLVQAQTHSRLIM